MSEHYKTDTKKIMLKKIKAVVTLYNVGSHLHRMVVSLCENGDKTWEDLQNYSCKTSVQ